ncbi:MAG: 4'-phosphopantetheinyl transferase superfamily protein [bacterium]|nr:4'-phosphopantetheinyl transferase superfamily protein [bacterium]
MPHLDLWTARFSDLLPRLTQLEALLTPDEHDRAGRFKFAEARQRFVMARGMLRLALGQQLDLPPAELRFTYGTRGKPTLSGAAAHFNLAHSGDVLLLGVTDAGAIGVDVEQLRPLPHLVRMAHDNFSPGEAAALFALPPEQQETVFLHIWTRKEAFIKATGDGFKCPLASFDVALDLPARLLRVEGDDASRWSLMHLDPAAGYVGAACIQTREAITVQWHIL